VIPRTRRLTVALACGIAVGAIGVTDVTTGPEFRFGFLYLAPIVVAGGWAGRGYALTCAAAGIALLLVNDVMLRSEATGLGLLWNEFTRATTFFASALLSAHLRQAWDQLRHEKEDAFSIAIRDPLTGVYNRIFLREQVQLLDALATRHGRTYCVIALDLDGLKELNDREGHAAGDEALSSFASDLRSCIRAEDVPVRIGGDEFIVLLADTDLDEAASIATRIVARAGLMAERRRRTRAASAGVAMWRRGRTPEDVFAVADRLLYVTKRRGGNNITVEADPAAVVGAR